MTRHRPSEHQSAWTHHGWCQRGPQAREGEPPLEAKNPSGKPSSYVREEARVRDFEKFWLTRKITHKCGMSVCGQRLEGGELTVVRLRMAGRSFLILCESVQFLQLQ